MINTKTLEHLNRLETAAEIARLTLCRRHFDYKTAYLWDGWSVAITHDGHEKMTATHDERKIYRLRALREASKLGMDPLTVPRHRIPNCKHARTSAHYAEFCGTPAFIRRLVK